MRKLFEGEGDVSIPYGEDMLLEMAPQRHDASFALISEHASFDSGGNFEHRRPIFTCHNTCWPPLREHRES
jgi:hypothetical protein